MDGGEADQLNYQRVRAYCDNSFLSDGLGAQFSADVEWIGKENKVCDEITGTGNAKADELQESAIVAEEIKTNGTSQREVNTGDSQISEGGANQTEELNLESQQQIYAPIVGQHNFKVADKGKNNTTVAKERVLNRHSTQSKLQKDVTRVLGKSAQKPKPCQNSSVSLKGVSKAVARNSVDMMLKHKNNTRQESQVEGTEITLPASDASPLSSVKHGTARSNYTVPEPFALATNKRASTGMHPGDVAVVHNGVRGTNASSAASLLAKKSVTKPVSAPTTPMFRSESLKLRNRTVKPLSQEELKEDDEDAHSADSLITTSRSPKARLSSASASGFSFRCNERAEKRKEFFSKLEEKIHAKEVEKSHLQAKSKESQEAEIKQLRKSLGFKATPMPSFYHEAPPPKVELKRIPTTRPISPKLGRQNSRGCSESESNSRQQCRTSCLSLDEGKINGDQQKTRDTENADKAFGKDSAAARKTMRRSLTRLPSERSIVTKPNERRLNPKQGPTNKSESGVVSGSIENAMVPTYNAVQDCSSGANAEKILNVCNSEGVKEPNKFQSSNEQDGIVENDMPRESESCIDGAKYAESDVLALHDNLHASEGSKSNSNGSDVPLYVSAIEQSDEEVKLMIPPLAV